MIEDVCFSIVAPLPFSLSVGGDPGLLSPNSSLGPLSPLSLLEEKFSQNGL